MKSKYRYHPIDQSKGSDSGSVICTQTKSRTASRRTSYMRYLFGFVFIPSVLHVVFLIGIREESYRAQQAESTTSKYLSPSVCARDSARDTAGDIDSVEDQVKSSSSSNSQIISTNELFTTIDSKQEALTIGMEIAHCGDCGQCSTDSDIELMIATKETLTKDATSCAVRGLLFGDEKIDACLQTIGFTPGCAVSIFVRSICGL